MSFVVLCVDGRTVRNQLAGDHVLAVETRNVQARVAMATDGINFDAVVKQQPHHVNLTTRWCRVQRSKHLN